MEFSSYDNLQKEVLFKRTFDQSPFASAIVSLDFHLLQVNKALCKMLGYETEELLGLPFHEITFRESLGKDREFINKLLSGEIEQYDTDKCFRHKNGHFVSAHVSVCLIKDEKGNPLYLFPVIEDLSFRKISEEKALESEFRVRSAVFENSPIGIGILRGEYLIDANPSYVQMFGFDDIEEMRNSSVLELMAPHCREYVADKIRRRMSGEKVETVYEAAGMRPDGSFFPFLVSVKTIELFDGRVTISFLIDITDRKKSEEAFRESENKYHNLFETMLHGVIYQDISGKIIDANPAAVKILGLSYEEIKGRFSSDPRWKAIHEDGSPFPGENHPSMVALKTGKKVQNVIMGIFNPETEDYRWVNINAVPQFKEGNTSPFQVYAIIEDITEKRKLLETAQKAQKLESIGVLAGGIAHDFNNLLGGIFGYLDLARDTSQDEEVSEYLEGAFEVFNRAKDLTRRLLTFSKGGEPVRKKAHFDSFIRENTSFALSGSNIKAEFRLDENLWECYFDENQISLVIDNIIINAKQAMPGGGIIEVSAENFIIKEGGHAVLRPGKYVKISIKDTGTGIPKELQSRIFDPFFTTKQAGSGLGLSICYSIMKKHEGFIELESEEGKGSTFYIFLPAANVTGNESRQSSVVEHKGQGIVLVMDDEGFVRDILRQILKKMGYYDVLLAKDGKDLLDLFSSSQDKAADFKAAILDLTIPGGMGGKEVIKELRMKYPDLPVFASSGYFDDPVMANPVEYGFTDSIAKPFKIKDLAEILNHYVK